MLLFLQLCLLTSLMSQVDYDHQHPLSTYVCFSLLLHLPWHLRSSEKEPSTDLSVPKPSCKLKVLLNIAQHTNSLSCAALQITRGASWLCVSACMPLGKLNAWSLIKYLTPQATSNTDAVMLICFTFVTV